MLSRSSSEERRSDISTLSITQKQFLVDATTRYHKAMAGSMAEQYLDNRGLLVHGIDRFRLGIVDDPLPGHEMFRGWLAIPYLRWSPGQGWSVVTMKFRCIQDHDCGEAHQNVGKYMAHPGGGSHVYNTLSILENEDDIAICEGELDAITACLAGIPAVGVPGIENWKPFYHRMFKGYKKVWMFADRDDSKGQGMSFARKLANEMGNLVIIPMPVGHDVNSTVSEYGSGVLLKAIGRETDEPGE